MGLEKRLRVELNLVFVPRVWFRDSGGLNQMPSNQFLGGQYINPWIRRFYLYAEGKRDLLDMHKVREARRIMPDQHGVLDLLSVSGEESVATLCLRCGFQGRRSYFTCFACLVSDKRLHRHLPAEDVAGYLHGLRSSLQVVLHEYRAQHRIWPCPLVLFQELWKKSSRLLIGDYVSQRRSRRLKKFCKTSAPCYDKAFHR